MRRLRAGRASRLLGAFTALAIGGIALAACGIATGPSASPISASQFRVRLHSSPPPFKPCQSGCVQIGVFFATRTGRLTAVDRDVPVTAKVSTVIQALLAGPNAADRTIGLETDLGTDIHLRSFAETVKKKSVKLNFTGNFAELSGAQAELAVAQVVYTVTSYLPGVGVTFETVGATIEVPVETGALSDTAVHEGQYSALLTTTAPKTTTTP